MSKKKKECHHKRYAERLSHKVPANI